MHHFIAQRLQTSVTALCTYMKHLMLLSVLKRQSNPTLKKNHLLVQRALTHKFPLPASGQTPPAFKLLSVWKTNADEASHLLCVVD